MRHRRWYTRGATFWAVQSPSGRVVLWFRMADDQIWELGHSREIPAGREPLYVIDRMYEFTVGDLSHTEYNALLPR